VFCGANLLQFVASIAPYFARVHGLTTIETGLCLGPIAVGAAIGSVLTGMLVKRYVS
jgi:hypothetical protein